MLTVVVICHSQRHIGRDFIGESGCEASRSGFALGDIARAVRNGDHIDDCSVGSDNCDVNMSPGGIAAIAGGAFYFSVDNQPVCVLDGMHLADHDIFRRHAFKKDRCIIHLIDISGRAS